MVKQESYTSATKLFRAIDTSSPYAEAARNYIKSLTPHTKLIRVYGSAEYFYDDNPGSASVEQTSQEQTTFVKSQGITLLGMLNTREFGLTDRLNTKLGYMFYGTFYKKDIARDNNFIGHYINPALSYRISSSTNLELKGNVEFLYFNQQKLSTNLGGTLTTTWTSKNGHSVNMHGSYRRQSYTDSYRSTGASVTSLEYLDADKYSVGVGGEMLPAWGGNLTLDYTFVDEHPINEDDPVLGLEATDKRFREHTIRGDVSLPFKGSLSRLSILGNASYSYKDYLNAQSGLIYASSAGKEINEKTLVLGIKAQITLLKEKELKLTVGMEQTDNQSEESGLEYDRNRYFVQLSAFF